MEKKICEICKGEILHPLSQHQRFCDMCYNKTKELKGGNNEKMLTKEKKQFEENQQKDKQVEKKEKIKTPSKFWKGPWSKIKCSKCSVEKSSTIERIKWLKKQGDFGKNLEKYLCRTCRKK